MTCDCFLKHSNKGVCTCELSYNDLFGSDTEEETSDYEESEEEEEKEDKTRITKNKDDWFVQ